jgi:hypothetical protein
MKGRVGRWITGAVALALLATATSVAIASGASSGYGQDPTGVPREGGAPYDGSLTSLVSPSQGGVVTGGRLAVVLRSRAPRGAIEVMLNGRRLAVAAAGGAYRASVSVGSALHLGENLITVSTNWGARFDFDSAQFVVARRVGGLASVQRLLVDGRQAPVAVSARVAPGARFRASVNGRDATSQFTRTGNNLVGLLGAGHGVRHGSNQLVLTAVISTAQSAQETTISRRFDVPRTSLIAGASADETVLAGQYVSLGAGRSVLVHGDTGRSYAWRLASAPRGSKAKLHGSARVNAWFKPEVPGVYRVRLTVRAQPRPSAGLASVAAAAAPGSTDTVLITVQTNRPFGVSLESGTYVGSIKFGGADLPHTKRTPLRGISYAVINRVTGRPRPGESGQFPIGATGLNQLLDIAKRHSDGDSLLVFNWNGALRPHKALLAEIFKLVGGGDLPRDDQFGSDNDPGSVIGVPGAPAGSAFINHRDPSSIQNRAGRGNMSGYLRLNVVTDRFDFVFASFPEVDTALPSKTTPTRSTIRVGAGEYPIDHPAGESGFHLVTVDPKNLFLIANRGYKTNNADGSPDSAGVARLANDLQSAADQYVRPLVILQSYGRPRGSSDDWARAGQAIQKLGGTRQVFADLNQPWAGGVGGDPTAGRRGGYAFIGRTGGTAPRVEVSYPLDGFPARLAGLLMLTRTADYEPLLVGAVRANGSPPVNEQLVRIANQAPRPFPLLAPDATREKAQAAENFVGGPAVMRVCLAGETCDVRKAYYTNYGGAWDTILAVLGNATGRCRRAPAGVDPHVCEEVREQLFDEVEATNRVRHYLGPSGLQQPFGAAGVAALANLGQISQRIQDVVRPRPQSPTTSQRLTLVSNLLRAGALAGPKVGGVASAIGAVFGLAAYLTKPDNSPNLIGPAVRTAAADLGVDLANRYQAAGDQLDGLGRLIVSDYGKLTAVASRVDADPNWVVGPLGMARNELVRAAKQTISEVVIPIPWPVLYDLGLAPHRNAGLWKCTYGFARERQKFLFDRNPAGGQVVQRFARNWTPVMAAGAVHTIGTQNNARIPTPPADVVDPLFAPPALGGLGMRKLEFYRPDRFRLLPRDPTPRPGLRDSLAYIAENFPPNCDFLPNPPGNSG